jgi:hypothetical protein
MSWKFQPRVVAVAALTCAVVAGCFRDPLADRVGGEDERIMRAMVDIACKLDVETMVISDRPAIPRESEVQGVEGRNVQYGIDLNQRIARKARWPKGDICPAVHVVDDSLIEGVLATDTRDWGKFEATFDGARSLMRISLPVYSSDGKRAVLYTSGRCPYTCGGGFYHELEKTNSGWRIANSANAWAM